MTVLQRPVPKEGDVQGLLGMIMDIQVRAWAHGVPICGAGSRRLALTAPHRFTPVRNLHFPSQLLA